MGPQQLLQVGENQAVGGVVQATQLSTKGALQLPEKRVGQGCNTFLTQDVTTQKVLGSDSAVFGELSEADLTLQEVHLDVLDQICSPSMTRGILFLSHKALSVLYDQSKEEQASKEKEKTRVL